MEKEILIQNLRNRLGADKASVISEKSFDAFGDMWKDLFADDSKITDDTWKEPLAILSQFAGQKRHDDASFAQKYQADYDAKMKAEWEKKIEEAKAAAIEAYKKEQQKGGAGNGKGNEGSKTTEEIIAEQVAKSIGQLTSEEGEIGKLNKLISGFIEESNKRDRATQLKTAQETLTEYLKGLGASSFASIEDVVKGMEYGDTIDVEALKPKAKAAYEAHYKRYYGDGGKPFGGGHGGGEPDDKETKDAIDKRIAQLAEEVKKQQSYQETMQKNFQ